MLHVSNKLLWCVVVGYINEYKLNKYFIPVHCEFTSISKWDLLCQDIARIQQRVSVMVVDDFELWLRRKYHTYQRNIMRYII